jgi:hypothetical protein
MLSLQTVVGDSSSDDADNREPGGGAEMGRRQQPGSPQSARIEKKPGSKSAGLG